MHRCGHLETTLPIVFSPQQALFTQVCSGTQLHSAQTNSLILNKWAIDFCLLSEQPEAFWTTIASPIKKKKKKSCDSRGNALSLLIIRFASRLSGPVPIFNLELLISTALSALYSVRLWHIPRLLKLRGRRDLPSFSRALSEQNFPGIPGTRHQALCFLPLSFFW